MRMLLLVFTAALGCAQVTLREAPLTVPTYPTAPPDVIPMFYEGRAYQGAKGPVYPYPIIDKLFDTRQDRVYKALWLENEYLRIGVLPELGGRIFEAVDKTNGYNFFYRQHVIKPALIGMLGAWISGGVEWNIPHHHRASSFMPVQYRLEESPDGSKTLWVGELELRHRMKWIMGLTLRPGKAYLEATLRLFNQTPLTHSFLYFANVAVHTNDNYQVIFPPSVEFATQHSKVQFSHWPISRDVYGGVDFTRGVDVSWWKNHPSATSMFAFECQEDFLAGYDHGKHAGTLHIAEHGVMPGKKFFTWGTGNDGQAWDHLLTDTDGPYLELMVGGYSDNQPDYSWIQPYEVKTVKEFWYPFREIGGVKNANLEAAVDLEVNGRTARLGFDATAPHAKARVSLEAAGRALFSSEIAIGPGKPFLKEIALPEGVAPQDLRASLSSGGRELIAYQPAPPHEASPVPQPVTPPPPPRQIQTIEELYLAGQRLEQFYSPAREPDPYYEEALRRDPSDSRANTALGLLYYRRGLFSQAEEKLRTAVARLTRNYTRPRDGESYYYLGLALKAQGKEREASEAFYRASWSYGWNTASYYALAELAAAKHDYTSALDYLDRSLATNTLNTKAAVLKAALMRHGGASPRATSSLLKSVLALDPLNAWAARELQPAAAVPELQDALEIAVSYGNAGLKEDAAAVLANFADASRDKSRLNPLVYYYLAYYSGQDRYYDQAAKLPADYCFPFRLEEIAILRRAIERSPKDPRAPYYLGNLLYDLQPQAAIAEWERARTLDPSFALTRRNLGLAYARRQRDIAKAIPEMEAAFTGRPDPRFLLELDQLYEAGGIAPDKRLAFLEKNHRIALERDDALAREIKLHVQMGHYDRALELLANRQFHVWEGARFTVHDSYVDAHLLRGHALLAAGKPAEALKDYQAALEYPPGHGIGKPARGDRSPVIDYYIGAAREAAGDAEGARQAWKQSLGEGRGRGMAPEITFHQALSQRKLGDEAAAAKLFDNLRESGRRALTRSAPVDDFAKFAERTPSNVLEADAHYVLGLAQVGAGNRDQARREFQQALQLDANQMWAQYMLSTLK